MGRSAHAHAGYPSLTFLHQAAEVLAAQAKPAVIYYLGDHDPSGLDIPRVIERELRAMAPLVPLSFTRLAVTVAQIETYGLPTRPTKATDSRAKGFAGESVEVDAIPAPELRRLVSTAIESHVDRDALARLLLVEEAERDTLASLAAGLAPGIT